VSTPFHDESEKIRVLQSIVKMKEIERKILENKLHCSHVSGKILEVPESFDWDLLEDGESPKSFVDVVSALINNDRFIGIDCSAMHYLNKAWEQHKVLSYIDQDNVVGKSALNIGGGSSLINSYLASLGMNMWSVDMCEYYPALVDNEVKIARSLDLDLTVINRDFLKWEDRTLFDYVFSICVIEHLPGRKEQAQFVQGMASRVAPGGYFLLTFGYGPKATDNPYENESDVAEEIISHLDGFEIVEPFQFSGLWTIYEGHTWGFVAAKKKSI
jgi:SAM-dependent methyltransferase